VGTGWDPAPDIHSISIQLQANSKDTESLAIARKASSCARFHQAAVFRIWIRAARYERH
jgi:hypothetical protein